MRYDSHVDFFAFDCRNPRAGMRHVSFVDALVLNSEEHKVGIFAPINFFHSPERKNSNVKKIGAWAIDMDEGSKPQQMAKLMRSPLEPSIIVESKRGYHAYWLARNARTENYKEVVAKRLVPYFGADKNATDISRVLRVPNFKHWKDENDPFDVKEVYRNEGAFYTEPQMHAYFPNPDDRKKREARPKHIAFENDGFWSRVYELNCEHALDAFSGDAIVSGEMYDFKNAGGRGGKNIIVNGEGTSCWIDANGKIGSSDGGGPSIANWLYWHCKDWAMVAKALINKFPELETSIFHEKHQA